MYIDPKDLKFTQVDMTVLREIPEDTTTESRIYQTGYLACLSAVRQQVAKAPAAPVIPIAVVKEYLEGLIKEWESLGDERQCDPRNMCVYNHVRAEMDALNAFCKENNLKF